MVAAALWALLGAGALLVGALVAFAVPVPPRALGLVMGFGAGTLISAVAFDLVLESYRSADAAAVLAGLVLGALVFWGGDWLLELATGGEDPVTGPVVAGPALVLGATLDGIPESVALGSTLVGGGTVSAALLVAVFLSNVPEGMAATVGLRRSGHSPLRVLGIWTAVIVASSAAGGLGYGVLGGMSPDVVAAIQAFAAGAILVMLATTMMPTAFSHGGREVGLLTVLGFILASGIAAQG